MSFLASTFIYNGIPSDFFGLYLYSFNNKSQDNGSFGGEGEIFETRIPSRYNPLHYGISRNSPMEFSLVFGTVGPCAMDRIKTSEVAEWLVGHQQYQWLYICQPDMEHVRYRCIIDDLTQIPINGKTVAFQATVRCDSPYAYHIPESITISSSGEANGSYFNPSNIHKEYYPNIEISLPQGSSDVSIWTDIEPDRKFILKDLSITNQTAIKINGENQLIEGGDTNWYQHSNMKFLRIWPGKNIIYVSGQCSAMFDLQPPINIGF